MAKKMSRHDLVSTWKHAEGMVAVILKTTLFLMLTLAERRRMDSPLFSLCTMFQHTHTHTQTGYHYLLLLQLHYIGCRVCEAVYAGEGSFYNPLSLIPSTPHSCLPPSTPHSCPPPSTPHSCFNCTITFTSTALHSCFQHSLQHAKLAKSTSFNN